MGRLWLGLASHLHAMSARTTACFRGLSGGRTARKRGPKIAGLAVCNQKQLAPQALERSDPKAPQATFFLSFRLKTLLCITFFFGQIGVFHTCFFGNLGSSEACPA